MRGEKLNDTRAHGAKISAAITLVVVAAAVLLPSGIIGQTAAQDTASAAAVSSSKDSSSESVDTEQKKFDSLTAVKSPADTLSSDSSKTAQVDSLVDKDNRVDSSFVDSLKTASVDSSANKQDSVSKADTLPSTVTDTSAKNTSDSTITVPVFANGDKPYDGRPVSEYDTGARASFKDRASVRWIRSNIVYILFFVASVLIIVGTVFFFLSRKDPRRFMTTTRLSVLDKMVQRGCRHIEANFADPALNVSTVCRELVTGEAYLDTLFVKEIGIDVRDFIAQVRVDRIRKILEENPEADIEATYRQCGFTDKVTADRAFAQLCGGVGMEVYAKSLVSAGRTPEP